MGENAPTTFFDYSLFCPVRPLLVLSLVARLCAAILRRTALFSYSSPTDVPRLHPDDVGHRG